VRITSLIAVLFTVLGLCADAGKANAGLFVSVTIAPPALPVYEQPPIPGPGYMWTPGYWAWDEDVSDYYWVPGAWAPAPEPGLLWTPGYWGWNNGVYAWNAGYWGPHIGFYGGVSYGFGYTGVGFAGGYWSGGAFFYNRSVANIGSVNITNVYNKTVINPPGAPTTSFNGGPNGIKASPTPAELQAASEPHTPPTKDQTEHQKLASQNKDLRASNNGGKPPIAATSRAGDFSPKSTFAAKGAKTNGLVKPASLTPSRGRADHSTGGKTGGSTTPHTKNALANKPGTPPKGTPPKKPMVARRAPPPPPHNPSKKASH